MQYENIVYECADGIATLTFNRPKALNALNAALLREFSQCLEVIDQDENVRVLILTGSGDKAFVAGADISELATLGPLDAKFSANLAMMPSENSRLFPSLSLPQSTVLPWVAAAKWPWPVISFMPRNPPCLACRRLPWASFRALAEPSVCPVWWGKTWQRR